MRILPRVTMMIFTFQFITMSIYSSVFGIDVSLATLDIMNLCGKKESFEKINNNTSSIKKWIEGLASKNVLCVLEPTGCYSNRILYLLNQENIPVTLVNPIQSHGFVQALGIISKDDYQAAKSLALMGQRLDLSLHKPKSEEMLKRKQILMGINALKKQKQALGNQLHALDNQIIFEPKVVQAFKQTLEVVEQQIKELEEQLNDISDEEHSKQYKLMRTVIGVGPKTAHLLLNATGGLHHFGKAGQLSKFTGLVPSSHKSGSSIRIRGRITKRGNTELRACLYMAARSARQYNFACKDLYERLRFIGKPHKQAMVAVMNKLVKQLFGVVKSGVSFDNQFYLKLKEL